MLAYVDSTGDLAVYDRATRGSISGLFPVGAGTIESIAVGGERSLFVSSYGAGLLHMDLYTGEVTTLVSILPELSGAIAKSAPLYISCPLYCYGPIEPVYMVSPGARLPVGTGSGLYLDDWTWSIGGSSSSHELHQVPSGISGRHTGTVTRPDLPWFALKFMVWVQPREVACFGSYHLDDFHGVATENPAKVGETIRVYMTGLSGVTAVPFQQPNPEGIAVANPPALADSGAPEILAFVLTPGDIGVQHVDLRVLRPSTQDRLFDPMVSQYGCAPPPVR